MIISGQNKLIEGNRIDVSVNDKSPSVLMCVIIVFNDDTTYVLHEKDNNYQDAISFRNNNLSVLFNIMPTDVKKICITASIEKSTTFNNVIIPSLHIKTESADIFNPGHTRKHEKSLMLLDIYQYKDRWKYRALCSGFLKGIDDLLAHFDATLCYPELKTVEAAEPTVKLSRRKKESDPTGL